MKLPPILILLLCLTHVTLSARIWTDREGREIEADFVALKGDFIHLSMNGREVAFPLNRLSAVDQNYVKRQVGTKMPQATNSLAREPSSAVKGGGTKIDFSQPMWIRIADFEGTDANGRRVRTVGANVSVSKDAIEWTQILDHRPITDFAKYPNGNGIRRVAVSNGSLVLAGFYSGTNWITQDGVQWAEPLSGNILYQQLISGGGKFWRFNGREISVSENGVEWTNLNLPPNGLQSSERWIADMAYGNGRLVMVGNRRRSVTDGNTWLGHSVLPEEEALERNNLHVRFGNGVFVFCHANGIEVSSDGLEWQKAVMPAELDLSDGEYYSPVFDGSDFFFILIQGAKRYVMKSKNGRDWTVSASDPRAYRLISGLPGKILSRRGSNIIVSSDGGDSWESTEVGAGDRYAIYYSDGEKIMR